MKPWMDRVDEAARTIVHQLKFNARLSKLEPATGTWSPAFLEHGLVQQAETEGWGRELRSYVLQQVRLKLMAWKPEALGMAAMPVFEEVIRDVDDLMPRDTEWIKAARHEAARATDARYRNPPVDPAMTERLVKAFKANPEAASGLLRIAMGIKEAEKRPQRIDASRPAIEHMQRTSRNNVHRTLSGLSRRMTGESK
jgi:hypothetical protein